MTVAALYVDPKGPYIGREGVDAWTLERDARRYPGPHPVVAHPPCADWSRLHGLAKYVEGRKECAPLAVWQVRACGGVLEHPAHSGLWRAMQLPLAGGLADAFGGFTCEVSQVAWGHPAVKPTWLYIVGARRSDIAPLRGGTPTHVVSTTHTGNRLLRCSALKRRLTPPAFAEWLVDIARMAGKRRAACS